MVTMNTDFPVQLKTVKRILTAVVATLLHIKTLYYLTDTQIYDS